MFFFHQKERKIDHKKPQNGDKKCFSSYCLPKVSILTTTKAESSNQSKGGRRKTKKIIELTCDVEGDECWRCDRGGKFEKKSQLSVKIMDTLGNFECNFMSGLKNRKLDFFVEFLIKKIVLYFSYLNLEKLGRF